jgi:copper homeostasis protein
MEFKLEICVDNVESAIAAQSSGAHRIELCDNLLEGGTTPGYGTIVSARDNLTIDVNVIIRPRGGDFLYSDIEYDIMRRDIDICGEIGIDGVVIGLLREDGSIDTDRTSRLIEYARPMNTTFHRAFDMCSDPVRGLEDVISTGAARLLTSGQKNSAIDGAGLITQLITQAHGRIIIMPGAGLNETNIQKIAEVTRAKEFHLTGRREIESEMKFRQKEVSMGSPNISEFKRKVADPEKIRHIIIILNKI